MLTLAVHCQLFMFGAVHCQLLHYDCSLPVLRCSLPAWTTFSVALSSCVHCHMVQVTVHCQWLSCCALPAKFNAVHCQHGASFSAENNPCVLCHMVHDTVRCQCLARCLYHVLCGFISCVHCHMVQVTVHCQFAGLLFTASLFVVRFAAACTNKNVHMEKILGMMFINSLLIMTARASP